MAKRSKSLEVLNDALVGVKPYEKRDFFNGCNEPGKAWFQKDAHEFIRIYCRICRNRLCRRAQGARTPWQARMEDQVEYLINDPQFSDLASVEHRGIAEMAWKSLQQKAERLEIAARRQDWEIPDGPTDGFARVAEKEVTDTFDDAVKALAKAQGKKEPELPKSEGVEGPAHFSAEPEAPPEPAPEPEPEEEPAPQSSNVEYETMYPSSDGTTRYRVALEDGKWSCACKAFEVRQLCSHLNTVRSWYEEQLRMEAAREAEENQTPPATVHTNPSGRAVNTPMPNSGIMLGGEAAPAQQHMPRPKHQAPHDPWAPTNDRIVKPGAQVVLGSKKNKDS
jgi:hypothetical protein